MAVTYRTDDEITEDEWVAMGNLPHRVVAKDNETTLWEGHAAGWAETATGALVVRRRVVADENHTFALEAYLAAAGTWGGVVIGGIAYDLDAIIAAEQANAEAQAEEQARIESEQRQATLITGGNQPRPVAPPNRAARRAQ